MQRHEEEELEVLEYEKQITMKALDKSGLDIVSMRNNRKEFLNQSLDLINEDSMQNSISID